MEVPVRNNQTLQITVLGINDQQPTFSDEVLNLIEEAHFFAGGKRHQALVAGLLPPNSTWTSITVPLQHLFQAMTENPGRWIVFASGDPLFFGIANTIKRELPEADVHVLPKFNSLQRLGHRLGINYGEYKTISLTGRSWEEFDQALIQGEQRMGILTDCRNTPRSIALRMIAYGYTNYEMAYGEHLGGDKERVLSLTLEEATKLEFKHPNCFFLHKTDESVPRKGIPDSAFEPLTGRPKMITKMGIRLTTLAFMELSSRQVFWDVGACTGSISIEARLNYPQLKVVAFEIREESEAIIRGNARRFQTPGIELFIGDYLEIDKKSLPGPDAVFLGGYGGRMEEILDDISSCLTKNGLIAFNSVSSESRERFLNWACKNHFHLTQEQCLTIDEHNPITFITIQR